VLRVETDPCPAPHDEPSTAVDASMGLAAAGVQGDAGVWGDGPTQPGGPR
jgi:hypothetical protein